MAILISAGPTHGLQRTGDSGGFVAQWPSHRLVVMQPPPPTLGVRLYGKAE